jgi:hypothetical protein
VALVYQDPIYEVVVAHYYLCPTHLAHEIVLAVLGDNAAAATANSVNPFDGEVADEEDGAEDEIYIRLQLDRNRLQHVRSLGAGQFGMVSEPRSQRRRRAPHSTRPTAGTLAWARCIWPRTRASSARSNMSPSRCAALTPSTRTRLVEMFSRAFVGWLV